MTDEPHPLIGGAVGQTRARPIEQPPLEVPSELESVYEAGLEIKARSQWSYAYRRFLRHRVATVSLVILILVFAAGFLAPYIAPYSPTKQDYSVPYNGLAPTFEGTHIFGTDNLGRDYLSRVLYGIKTSARVALIVALLSTFIGTAIGAIAGYFGGAVDNAMMRFTDFMLTLPLLVVVLTVSSRLGSGDQYQLALLLAFFLWTQLARIVRGQFLSLREKEYVEAAKAVGAGDLRIMLRHMLPNATSAIIVNATLTVALAILLESVLSFLGYGIKPPTPALGSLINDAQEQMLQSWWLVTFPGLMIVLIVLCINFVGDGLRDALDPTQRRVRA
jgi:peptide/nickel transport system permease protein